MQNPADLTDLEAFLALAAGEGLHAIVRPGPYICAEWDNGGLPSWLTGTLPPRRLRCADPEHRPEDPWFCMEFWCGWFDHWGHDRVLRDPADAAKDLDTMLAAGASVNVYMAHGGTNFGTTAGANLSSPALDRDYRPTITSYDYDAPIDEAGRATPKFWAFRDVLAGYRNAVDGPLPEPPAPTAVQARASVALDQVVRLADVFDDLAGPEMTTPQPPTLEELGIGHGLVRYTATVPGPRQAYPLVIDGLADRAHVRVDGRDLGVVERDKPADLTFAVAPGGARLELLVESMGRANYGPLLGERKGITGGVLHDRQYVHGFTTRALPLDGALPAIPWHRPTTATSPDGPVFRRGQLTLADPADAWLLVPDGGKGYLWVNGFLLGRYWSAGPQRALYAPAPLRPPCPRDHELTGVIVADRPRSGPVRRCGFWVIVSAPG